MPLYRIFYPILAKEVIYRKKMKNDNKIIQI